MSKTTSFVKEVLARIKGDNVAVIAEKNYRKATAGINGQIASLNGRLVEEEEKVDEASENLANAKYPTDVITDVTAYVKKIRDKQEAYDKAVDNLATVKDSLDYYKTLLAGFESQTETPE